MNDENIAIISCKECGWDFPLELIKQLIDGELEVIYCESCGSGLNKQEINFNEISETIQQSHKQVPKTLVDILSIARKKSKEYSKKIKSKYKELKSSKSSNQS
ncbi:MAG: hypothetical protein ACFFAO_21570 [Candidatus Hermodarchaeota archaeon]